MFTIEIHSMVDLITNSSTELFTNSDESPKVLEEMINEFFKVFGINYKCLDIFTLTLMLNDRWEFYGWIKDHRTDKDIPKSIREAADKYGTNDKLDDLIEKIINGKKTKPDWFIKMEEDICNDQKSSTLYITEKEPKYKKLALLVSSFLYSTTTQESCDY